MIQMPRGGDEGHANVGSVYSHIGGTSAAAPVGATVPEDIRPSNNHLVAFVPKFGFGLTPHGLTLLLRRCLGPTVYLCYGGAHQQRYGLSPPERGSGRCSRRHQKEVHHPVPLLPLEVCWRTCFPYFLPRDRYRRCWIFCVPVVHLPLRLRVLHQLPAPFPLCLHF